MASVVSGCVPSGICLHVHDEAFAACPGAEGSVGQPLHSMHLAGYRFPLLAPNACKLGQLAARDVCDDLEPGIIVRHGLSHPPRSLSRSAASFAFSCFGYFSTIVR